MHVRPADQNPFGEGDLNQDLIDQMLNGGEDLQPEPQGYRVVFDRILDGRLVRGEECGAKVIVAAGSLGSTELLLRCRDQGSQNYEENRYPEKPIHFSRRGGESQQTGDRKLHRDYYLASSPTGPR